MKTHKNILMGDRAIVAKQQSRASLFLINSRDFTLKEALIVRMAKYEMVPNAFDDSAYGILELFKQVLNNKRSAADIKMAIRTIQIT